MVMHAVGEVIDFGARVGDVEHRHARFVLDALAGTAGSAASGGRRATTAARPAAAGAASRAGRDRARRAGVRRRTAAPGDGRAGARSPAVRPPPAGRSRRMLRRECASKPYSRLRRTVRCGNSWPSWNTRPKCRSQAGTKRCAGGVDQHVVAGRDRAACAGAAVRRCSASSVLLPEPDGPQMPVTPAPTSALRRQPEIAAGEVAGQSSACWLR